MSPYFAPTYFTPAYYDPGYFAGFVTTPPSAPTIAISTANGVDTITYTAASPGTNAVAGVSLYLGGRPGQEASTAVGTHTGTAAGSFTHAIAPPGETNYYIVEAFDTEGFVSAASNEVFSTTAVYLGPPAGPVGGGYVAAGLMLPTTPSSAVSAPSYYWNYFTAAGNYLLQEVGGLLVVTPTGLSSGGAVAHVPSPGFYTATFTLLRSGRSVVTLSSGT